MPLIIGRGEFISAKYYSSLEIPKYPKVIRFLMCARGLLKTEFVCMYLCVGRGRGEEKQGAS